MGERAKCWLCGKPKAQRGDDFSDMSESSPLCWGGAPCEHAKCRAEIATLRARVEEGERALAEARADLGRVRDGAANARKLSRGREIDANQRKNKAMIEAGEAREERDEARSLLVQCWVQFSHEGSAMGLSTLEEVRDYLAALSLLPGAGR